MSEERIAALLKKAEPLRDPEHPEHNDLGPIVDEINSLRNAPPPLPPVYEPDPEAPMVVETGLPKRRPGRPRNPA